MYMQISRPTIESREKEVHKRTQGASTIASLLVANSKVPKFRLAKK